MPETDDELSEPADAGEHEVPTALVELHEVLEWQAAVETSER